MHFRPLTLRTCSEPGTSMCTFLHTHLSTCLLTFSHTSHTCLYTSVHTCLYTCVHTCSTHQDVFGSFDAEAFKKDYDLISVRTCCAEQLLERQAHTHVYTHVYTDACTHVYTHVCTHVYAHVCTHAYAYLHTCRSTCICTFIRNHSFFFHCSIQYW